jgi:hypothetical protein
MYCLKLFLEVYFRFFCLDLRFFFFQVSYNVLECFFFPFSRVIRSFDFVKVSLFDEIEINLENLVLL